MFLVLCYIVTGLRERFRLPKLQGMIIIIIMPIIMGIIIHIIGIQQASDAIMFSKQPIITEDIRNTFFKQFNNLTVQKERLKVKHFIYLALGNHSISLMPLTMRFF